MAAGTLCPDCIEHTPNFDKARSVFKYNDISGQMITGLKFQDKTPYAKTLANLMSPRLSEFGDDFDIITSVPLHPLKLIKRKYNQAAVLANKLARLNNKKANNLILKKVRNIKPQTSLTRKERIENVRGAIEINKKYISDIKGKNILLVDDVMTTGATANECAKILKNSGAEKIYLLTAVRTIIEK